jgi:hypothetical protein
MCSFNAEFCQDHDKPKPRSTMKIFLIFHNSITCSHFKRQWLFSGYNDTLPACSRKKMVIQSLCFIPPTSIPGFEIITGKLFDTGIDAEVTGQPFCSLPKKLGVLPYSIPLLCIFIATLCILSFASLH